MSSDWEDARQDRENIWYDIRLLRKAMHKANNTLTKLEMRVTALEDRPKVRLTIFQTFALLITVCAAVGSLIVSIIYHA